MIILMSILISNILFTNVLTFDIIQASSGPSVFCYLTLTKFVNNNAFMEQEQEKPLPEETKQQVKKEQPQVSEHAQYYKEKLSNVVTLNKNHLITPLQPFFELEEIYFDKEMQPFKEIKFKIQETTVNMEAISLHAAWGQFSMKINILNVPYSNPKHKNCFKEGTYGKLYHGKYFNSKIVLKCIPIKTNLSRLKAIRQFFLLKIASAAQFGPSTRNYFGFDMVMYQDCCQFAMESCSEMFGQKLQYSVLYKHMATMHSLHISHLDIKPENIMFSPTFNKAVFIDFGLSKMVVEDIGFKTLTYFVGTMNFCSDEMGKIFLNENLSQIDLYYNDLHGLELSLKSLKFFTSNQTQQLEEYQSPPQVESDLNYLRTYLLKYLLFYNNIKEFILNWDRLFCLEDAKIIKNEVLSFFLEVIPNSCIKQIFEKIAPTFKTSSDLIQRIQLLFQISHQKFSTLSWFQDKEMKILFQEYCDEYLNVTESLEKEEKNRKAVIAEIVLSQQLISKTPFFGYASLLLEWMSYVNNKFGVNSSKREGASKIYYQLFVSAENIPEKRALIEAAILNLLDKYLSSSEKDMESDSFGLNIFRLYDYILILDLGSVEEVIGWLDRILSHSNLASKYRVVLVLRVSQSFQFSQYRMSLKCCKSRTEVSKVIEEWIFKQVDIFKQQTYPQVNQHDIGRGWKQGIFPSNFLVEFGHEVLSVFSVSCLQFQISVSISRYMTIFNEHIVRYQYPKILYFLCKIYDYYYFHSNSTSFGTVFLRKIKSSLADEEIYQQFSFESLGKIQKFLKSTNLMQKTIPKEFLITFNNTISLVPEKDLVLYEQFIGLLFNRLLIQNKFLSYQGENGFIFTSQESIIKKYIKAFTKAARSKFGEQHNESKHVIIESLMNLLTMSKAVIPSQETEVLSELFSKESLQVVSCKICKGVLNGISYLAKLQTLIIQMFGQKKTARNRQDSLKEFFSISSELQTSSLKEFQPQIYLKMMAICWRMGQILCCMDQQIEKQYHGIEKFYHMTIKFNLFKQYFQNQVENNLPIMKTLELFKSKHQDSLFIDFLLKVADYPHKSRLMRDYLSVIRFSGPVLAQMSDQQQYELVLKLKITMRSNSKLIPSVATILSTIVISLRSYSLKKKVCAVLLRVVQHLFYFFRNHTKLIVYQVVWMLMKVYFKRRQFLFCNNRFVKLLVNEDYLLPAKKEQKRHRKNIFLEKLREKARKIPRCRFGLLKLKFLKQ